MSVDDTIRELSGTLNQLGLLVGKINEQIGGLSSRINLTLQNFDNSVAGIAKDANKMTDQVDNTIAQIPGSWAFYLFFFALIAVLVLLSILIIINLIVKIQSICRNLRADSSSRSSTPLEPLVHSDSKQPLHPVYSTPREPQQSSSSGGGKQRSRHLTVEMEAEPRRYGIPQAVPPVHHATFSSGRTTATTTYAAGHKQQHQASIYHQQQQQPHHMATVGGHQMEFYHGNGNGTAQGSSPICELRGRHAAGGGNPRTQPV